MLANSLEGLLTLPKPFEFICSEVSPSAAASHGANDAHVSETST